MKRGKFILIEGGEGSGKGECIRFLERSLKEIGYEVIATREPGGTPVSEKIRELIFSDEIKEGNPEVFTQLLLFEAARTEHMSKVIVPALESGKIVLSDRGFLGTFAYQIAGEERRDLQPQLEIIDKLARLARWNPMYKRWEGDVKPDLTLFLDVDPEIGLMRAKKRGEGNHFDEKELAFHQRVRDGYHEILPMVRHNIIDAGQIIEIVHREALQSTLNLMRS